MVRLPLQFTENVMKKRSPFPQMNTDHSWMDEEAGCKRQPGTQKSQLIDTVLTGTSQIAWKHFFSACPWLAFLLQLFLTPTGDSRE